MNKHSYTQVTEDVVQCNDCGAFADSAVYVVHHSSCKPGESAHWQDVYDNLDPDEDIPF